MIRFHPAFPRASRLARPAPGLMTRPLCLLLLVAGLGPLGAEERPVPRLAVVVSVDQMRGDYLKRFGPYFGADGFNRLVREGADFQNCHYNHAFTITAPGHATILSGVNPSAHGIIGNDWRDPASFVGVNAVQDVDSPLVGVAPRGPNAAQTGRSPRNFLGTTVGDRLKERYGAAAKVFGVADKDRSAILMAGAKADGAYWSVDGKFVTSTYYHRELPAWVQEFNAANPPEGYFGRVWERLREVEIYDTVQGPDDATGEYSGQGLTRTFPKRIDGGKPEPSNGFLWTLELSPWGNELVAGLAMRLIESEGLGIDDTPDLLCVGFSQTDRIGHSYGPDSHEVMDSFLRLDQVLAEFLRYLDQRVGRDHYVLVLTADHGVGPIPEQTIEKRGADAAGRISGSKLEAHVSGALAAAFGPAPEGQYWALRDGSGYRLNSTVVKHAGADPAKVRAVLRDALATFPGIADVWTRDQLLGEGALGGYGERMRLSYNATRSPDVVFLIQPFWLAGTTTANHGTPYDYDSHVPQVWVGGGFQAGARAERVAVEDLAPTLAGLLGVELPPEAKGRRLF